MPGPIERIHADQRMSQAVKAGDFVFITGQAADDPTLDIVGQTKQVLAKIDGLLAEFGLDKSALVSATIWLETIHHYATMNAVWDEWIAPVAPPARACGEGRISTRPYLVEIGAIAFLGDRK